MKEQCTFSFLSIRMQWVQWLISYPYTFKMILEVCWVQLQYLSIIVPDKDWFDTPTGVYMYVYMDTQITHSVVCTSYCPSWHLHVAVDIAFLRASPLPFFFQLSSLLCVINFRTSIKQPKTTKWPRPERKRKTLWWMCLIDIKNWQGTN